MRAIQPRTTRYDSRTFFRNHCVTIAISGSTANATSASRQFMHEHHRHDAEQREHVAEDRDHARREQVVQDVHVRRDPRHQPADRIVIVVAHVEPLQVAVNPHADVEHDPLAGQLHRPGLDVLGHEAEHQHAEIQERQRSEAVEIAGRDVLIDRHLHQVGLRQRHRRAQRNRDERQRHLPPVRAQVGQQPAHQPRVVGLSEDFVVVLCHGDQEAASSSSSSCFLCSSAYSPFFRISSSCVPRSTMGRG